MNTFEQLNLSKNILKAVMDMGFTEPSEIQEKAIPMLLEGDKDFIGQAQTGTGKTAAFVIPLLERIDTSEKTVQALILAPTRELAHQVEKEIEKLGKYTDIRSTSIYGGTSYDKQIKALKQDRPHIVVGTPGRVIDMINKRLLKLDNAKFCVLDEADEMLNMGFYEDVETILGKFSDNRQLVMFSATMPKAILDLIQRSFKEYNTVKIKKKSLSNDDIEQKYFVVRNRHHTEALARLIEDAEDPYAIVFCKTKIETVEVGNELKNRGYRVEILNGDMGQSERERVMKSFKDKRTTLLICTDIAARGIDVNNLTHVFNYGLPQHDEAYVHRIGRTGRAGQTGKAYTIVGPKSVFALRKIERHINKKIELEKLPTTEQLKRKLIKREIATVANVRHVLKDKDKNFTTDDAFDVFFEEFSDLSQEQLLKLMFTWKFNKLIRHFDNLGDIEDKPSFGRNDRPRGRDRNAGRNARRRNRRDGDREARGGGERRNRGEKRRSNRRSDERRPSRRESFR